MPVNHSDSDLSVRSDEDAMFEVIELGSDYDSKIIEIPRSCGMSLVEFFKSTDSIESEYITKPYPNEHACPHASSERYDSFRRGIRSHEGKQYSVIYGRVRGTNRWEEEGYRYHKSIWGASDAKAHCKSHGGVAFESATKGMAVCDGPDLSTDVKKVPCDVESGRTDIIDVRKKDDLRHLVYGIVLEPNVFDLQGDIERPVEIEKSAHRYMARMWANDKPSLVGAEHDYPIEKAIPVESFIAPCDFWYDGSPQDEEHLVRKGSWIVVSLIEDDDEFNNVKIGKYTGYSMQGVGNRSKLS